MFCISHLGEMGQFHTLLIQNGFWYIKVLGYWKAYKPLIIVIKIGKSTQSCGEPTSRTVWQNGETMYSVCYVGTLIKRQTSLPAFKVRKWKFQSGMAKTGIQPAYLYVFCFIIMSGHIYAVYANFLDSRVSAFVLHV